MKTPLPIQQDHHDLNRHVLDTTGLRCPQPVLRLAVLAAKLPRGLIVEILGDCPTFERDIRVWCQRLDRTLLAVHDEIPPTKRIQVLL